MNTNRIEEPIKRLDAEKIAAIRRRLTSEYQKLIKSVDRTRLAAEGLAIENTEDEGDLAAISHEKDILYNLHQNDFKRSKFIQQALKAIDRGQYGECVRCGEGINEKRLEAVPWATTCIQCQEEMEADLTSKRMVLPGLEVETEL